MQQDVSLRLATSADVFQIADLRWRLQTDDVAEFDAKERQRFVTNFAASSPDSSFHHWVAEADGRLVAVMSVCKVSKLPSPRKRSWVLGLPDELPEFRSRGIGERLLQCVKQWAGAEQLEFLIVWPSDRSYQFYERSGFERHRDPLVLKLRG